MQFATLNDVLIHHQLIGGPKGKPCLVFINALGSDFRIWRDVIVRLAGDFPIVNYDKRGHGLSAVGTAPYTMDDHADDLAALLDHLNVTGAVLVGLSVGGLIAQLLASKRPDLVAALVLADTGYKIGDDALWNERIEAIQTGGMGVAGDAVAERWFTEAFRTSDPDAVSGFQIMVSRMPLDGYIGTCAAIRDCDLKEIASTLPIPVSCLVGDQDVATTPDLVLDMARTIPGARYDVIKDAGHMPCVEQPAMMAEIIAAFVLDVTK